ncbi:hypothetical protein MBLNU13_g07890t1 [Cladosporium sp. NU13]
MSGQRFLLPTTGSNEVSRDIPRRNEKLPNPDGGKPKRTQVQNACTSCRERKSKCDGIRYLPYPLPYHRCHKSPDDPAGSPVCSLCQASGRECEYNTGEGETRWAALQRKNRELERERDEARELLALIQSLPDAEAQVIFRRVRLHAQSMDIGVFVQQVRKDMESGVCTEPGQQQLLRQLPSSNLGSETSSSVTLPPLRSVIEMLRAETTTALNQPSVALPEDTESP